MLSHLPKVTQLDGVSVTISTQPGRHCALTHYIILKEKNEQRQPSCWKYKYGQNKLIFLNSLVQLLKMFCLPWKRFNILGVQTMK